MHAGRKTFRRLNIIVETAFLSSFVLCFFCCFVYFRTLGGAKRMVLAVINFRADVNSLVV